MDGDTLRDLLAAAYGTRLEGISLAHDDDREPAAISLADRIAPMLGAPLADRPAPQPAEEPPPWPRWADVPTRTAEQAVDDVRAVTTWATARGADLEAIEIRVSPTGNRSVYARRPIWRQDPVMFVPRDLMIVDENIEASGLGEVMSSLHGELASGHTPLAVWLASERLRPDSPWRTYLESLPSTPDLPAFRDRADMALLVDTTARLTALRHRLTLDGDHAKVAELLGDQAPSLAALAWARAVIGSRLFKLEIDGNDRRVLVPVADFFDAGDGGDATWSYNDADRGLVVTAARNIAEGEEIRLRYGEFTNAHFLTHYGFGAPDNPDDTALLVFPPAPDPLRDVAAAALWGHPLSQPVAIEAGYRIESGFRRALSLARMRAASYRDLIKGTDAGRWDLNELLWLHADHDRAALELIADAARAGIARLDAHALTDVTTPWQRTVATVRAGERAEPYLADPSPWPWRRAATSMDIMCTGADCLVRSYILMIADELPR